MHVDTQQLRVVVTDANEYAVSPITDADPGTEAVDENAAIGTTVGFTASAVDADGKFHWLTKARDTTNWYFDGVDQGALSNFTQKSFADLDGNGTVDAGTRSVRYVFGS